MDNFIIRQFELGNMGNFNYFMGDAQSHEIAIVDPGDDTDFLLSAAKKEGLKITSVLLTHGHYDHVGGVPELSASLKIPVYLSAHETPSLTPVCPTLHRTKDNEEIAIGNIKIRCLHTPGHTPGCQCFLASGNLITGDTLFIDAIGRTDLPGGSASALFLSLQRIKKLPGSTVIWPGHNYGAVPKATLNHMLIDNPFLRCDTLEAFVDFTR
jgi:glyoxylase-like metal-dependent hydrolase (beta-lactamase superfamily II)